MFLIGLTGGIASGKSIVSCMLKEYNIPIIDADLIARFVVELDKPAWKLIRKEFGTEYFLDTGELDREKLGDLVFSDSEARKKLNKITHPQIHKEMRKQIWKYFWAGEQFVVLETPLLYETKRALDYLHKVIVVTCEDEMQLERLMKRNQLSEHEGIKRIEVQMPLEEKCSMADFVIENSGSIAETRKQVECIVKLLRTSNHHNWNRLKLFTGLVLMIALFVSIMIRYFS